MPGHSGRAVLNPDGEAQDIGRIKLLTMREGDLLRMESPSGGGFGDPSTRDPELVLSDVLGDGLEPRSPDETGRFRYAGSRERNGLGAGPRAWSDVRLSRSPPREINPDSAVAMMGSSRRAAGSHLSASNPSVRQAQPSDPTCAVEGSKR